MAHFVDNMQEEKQLGSIENLGKIYRNPISKIIDTKAT